MENHNNENLEDSSSKTTAISEEPITISEISAAISEAPTADFETSCAPVDQQLISQAYTLRRQINSGTSFFYVVAAFSLVNCFLILDGMKIRNIFGLEATDFITAFIHVLAPSLIIIAIIINLLISSLFFLFGYFAKKEQAWAFILGLIFYSLDCLLLLLVQDWVSIAIHVMVLFYVVKAFQASLKLKKLKE